MLWALLITIAALPNDGGAAEQRLMRLLDATHGAGEETSPGVAQDAARVCGEFERYSALIDRWIDPAVFSTSQDPQMPMRVANASAIAASCGQAGLDLLVPRLEQSLVLRDQKLRELLERAKNEKDVFTLRRQVDALIDFERRALHQLAAAKSDRMVEPLIDRVKTDPQLSLNIVRYFSRVAPRNQAVTTALRSLHHETKWRDLQLQIEAYFKL